MSLVGLLREWRGVGCEKNIFILVKNRALCSIRKNALLRALDGDFVIMLYQ